MFNDVDLSPVNVEIDEDASLLVFCVSDLHADGAKGQEWVTTKCNLKTRASASSFTPPRHPHIVPSSSASAALVEAESASRTRVNSVYAPRENIFSIMIVPGDIGTDISKISRVFAHLVSEYDLVCYTPGNHEAWRGVTCKETFTSLDKLNAVLKCANELGVCIGPVKISRKSTNKCIESTHLFPAATQAATLRARDLLGSLGSVSPPPSLLQFPKIDILGSPSSVIEGVAGNLVDCEPSTPPSMMKPLFEELSGSSSSRSNSSTSSDNCDSIGKSSCELLILPLFSWYHSSFDQEAELKDRDYLKMEKEMPFGDKWADFSMIKWPESLISSKNFKELTWNNSSRSHLGPDNSALARADANVPQNVLANYFASLNGPIMRFAEEFKNLAKSVITFSHFVPRHELVPEKRFLLEPMLMKVVGSDPLEMQIREIKPDLHMFGHTHIPIDLQLEGIRYCQWPLGYTREADLQCASIHNSGPLLCYDSRLSSERTIGSSISIDGIGSKSSSIPFERNKAPLFPSSDTYWSKYYRDNARDPSVSDISPWLKKRIESFSALSN